jgi:N-acetyl-gamma-glutamyl-phosphate reductase
MHNYTTPRRFRAGILGYSGYSGAELSVLLGKHPAVAPVLLDHRRQESSSAGVPGAIERLPWSKTVVADEKLDVVFTGTPPEISLEVIPEIRAQGARAIDLSGAFRLSAAQYERWYGAEHSHPELLPQSVYGLPELFRERISAACLIANPGCYPTAAILGLWPLVREDWVDRAAGIVCDAKSGVTGAGKTPSPKTHFVQVSENFSAYAVLKHRHVPEVLNSLGLAEQEFDFTAQLLPIQRGILETHYLRLRRATRLEELLELYGKLYQDSPFIRLPQRDHPEGSTPQVSAVQRTNFCDIHFVLGGDGKRLVVISCIDNLVKGAAGQAIQNMNLMFGLEETAGLL